MYEFYAYVWRSSASQQIVLIILAVIAALMAMAPLELQRHIINTLAGHEKAERLALLCGAYLIAALSIGGLKYLLNIKSAGLGESMILSLRKDIFSSSSPLKSGEPLNETVKDKAGTFVAMIATPTVQAGTLLSVFRLHAVHRASSRAGRFVHRRSAGLRRSNDPAPNKYSG
jgi:ABC-type multidrug transport system fused ATPase/permease subunit